MDEQPEVKSNPPQNVDTQSADTAPPPAPVAPQPASALPGQPVEPEIAKVPWYRKYWPFGLIFIFAPLGVIFGIVILATGDIYRTKNGLVTPISKKEKTALIVVAVILQIFATIRPILALFS